MKRNYFMLCMLLISSIVLAQNPILRPEVKTLLFSRGNNGIEPLKRSPFLQTAKISHFKKSAQNEVLFFEDFNTQAAEENDYFPEGWDGYNFDGNTINGGMLGYEGYLIGSDWMQLGFQNDPGNRFYVSFSYFCDEYGQDLPGTADDWLVSPAIELPANTAGTKLSFLVSSLSEEYPDGFEVWVIEAANYTAISGMTSAKLVAASTRIYKSESEPAGWTSREVLLDEFMGKSVRIMFRNNTYDMYAVMVDEVMVTEGESGDPCPAISNLESEIEGNDVVLTWDAPIETPTGYTIYKNGAKLATTNETTYTATALTTGKYTFSVEANYDGDCRPKKVATPEINIQTCDGTSDLTVTYTQDCKAELAWDTPKSAQASEVLWDNTAGETETGFHSVRWLGGTDRLVMADDFDVEEGETWTIEEVYTGGFYSQGATTPQYIGVEIYKDNGNKPGDDPIYENTSLIPTGGVTAGYMNIPLPEPFVISESGKYWISIYGAYTGETQTSNQYYLLISTVANGQPMHRWDPNNMYGNGTYVNWKAGTTTDATHPSMVFSITGEKEIGELPPAKYNIYRDGVQIATEIEETTYTDAGFNPSTGHEWAVAIACPKGGESAWDRVAKSSCDGTSIENPLTESLEIYPNPASSEVSVIGKDIQKIEVYNAVGQLIEKVGNVDTISVSSYTSGIYFFRVFDSNNNIATKRVVVL